MLPACTSKTSEIHAISGQEFSLAIGQTAVISGENVSVKFTDVVGDSRCPDGVMCVWAGQVSCSLDVVKSGAASQMVITAPGDTTDYTDNTYQNYRLQFRVDPYPQSGKKINKSDYRLFLIIHKNP
jgi:hypothetical protein